VRRRRVNLHLFETPATHETRFLKGAFAVLGAGLAEEVVLLARQPGDLPSDEHPTDCVRVVRLPLNTRVLPANKLLALIKIAEAQWRFFRAAVRIRPQSVHCHSLSPLPAAVWAARRLGVPLVYDAHELETERNGLRGLKQKVDRWVERRLIRYCDAVIVVSDSIADWYARAYRIERPAVVRNIPDVRNQTSPEDRGILRRRFGIKDEALVFLYQGGLFVGRRIEQLLRVFAQAGPTRHVVFMGYGELEGLVREAAAQYSNIHFLPAVPPGDVLRHTVGADVGLVGVENICLSYFYCLPNKFFEYLLAGVPVLANDWPEMGKVVREQGCGWLVGEGEADWLAVVQRLRRAEVEAARTRAREAARHFSWENEEKVLLSVYRRLLA